MSDTNGRPSHNKQCITAFRNLGKEFEYLDVINDIFEVYQGHGFPPGMLSPGHVVFVEEIFVDVDVGGRHLLIDLWDVKGGCVVSP